MNSIVTHMSHIHTRHPKLHYISVKCATFMTNVVQMCSNYTKCTTYDTHHKTNFDMHDKCCPIIIKWVTIIDKCAAFYNDAFNRLSNDAKMAYNYFK